MSRGSEMSGSRRDFFRGVQGLAIAAGAGMVIESAKAAGRNLRMFAVMIISFALAFAASFASKQGWLGWFLLAEAVAGTVVYVVLFLLIKTSRWSSME